MKKLFSLLLLLVISLNAYACPVCNQAIRDGILGSTFYPNLLIMLSAFIVLAILVAILSVLAMRSHMKRLTVNPSVQVLTPVPLTTASTVLGIGLGGFFDGIVLHQVLQVHEMLSNKVPATEYIGKSINMFWDGIFHAFCLIVVLIGIILFWRLLKKQDIDRSGALLGGGLLIGWAMFNIVEGVIDHHLLKLQNVIEFSADHNTANYIFLGVSVVMFIIGYLIVKSSNRRLYITK